VFCKHVSIIGALGYWINVSLKGWQAVTIAYG